MTTSNQTTRANQPPPIRDGGHAFAPLERGTLDDPIRYARWQARKLARAAHYLAQPLVEIDDPMALAPAEVAALRKRVDGMNFVLYRIRGDGTFTFGHRTFDHRVLKRLCQQVGLERLDANPFAAASGVSDIRVTAGAQGAYIPYTDRALNWHTDGYYNAPARTIHGFAMHTLRAAASGGENQFLDHELLYLLLREQNPDGAACLFDEVMGIPPDIGARASDARRATPRAARFGAVFSTPNGRLHARLTLRKRHIYWKQSKKVQTALANITAILTDPNLPFILKWRFAPGEGVLCNNVLHNRAAFTDPAGGDGRLVLRARFYDRIGG